MSAQAAGPEHRPVVAHGSRPSLLEAVRFYVFAGSSVVLAVLLVVLAALDATR